jgi:hypothetical protein
MSLPLKIKCNPLTINLSSFSQQFLKQLSHAQLHSGRWKGDPYLVQHSWKVKVRFLVWLMKMKVRFLLALAIKKSEGEIPTLTIGFCKKVKVRSLL